MSYFSKTSDLNCALRTATITAAELPGTALSVDVTHWALRTASEPAVRARVLDGRAVDEAATKSFQALGDGEPLTIENWCADPARRTALALYVVAPLSYWVVLRCLGKNPIIALEGKNRDVPTGGARPLSLRHQQLNRVVELLLTELGVNNVRTSRTGEASAGAALSGLSKRTIVSVDAVDVCANGGVAVTLDAAGGAVQQAILRGQPAAIKIREKSASNQGVLAALAVLQYGGGSTTGSPSTEGFARCSSVLAPPFCPPRGDKERTVVVRALKHALSTCGRDAVTVVRGMLAAPQRQGEVTELDPRAPPAACLRALTEACALKTPAAKREALRFADELLGSVAGASTEMDPRQVRAPLNPSRPRATVLYLCGWGEAAACDAAKELAAADDACAALRAKTPFGPGGGSPRPHSSSSRPAKRPSTPAPELRGPPPKRSAPLPKKPAAKAKPAPGTSGPLGGWARVAKKLRAPPPRAPSPRAPPPPRARASPPPVAPTPAEPWTCANCTYHHADREATFLQCAMCGGTEKSTGPGEA
jgi:hypothetical protein